MIRDLDIHLAAFAKRINGGTVTGVDYRPEEWAVACHCFANVAKKIERDGGGEQVGWTFFEEKGFLVAIHHSLWSGPNGWVDVTPYARNWSEIRLGNQTAFLPDDLAVPILPTGFTIPHGLPNKYYLIEVAELEYMRFVRQCERSWWARVDGQHSAPQSPIAEVSGSDAEMSD